MLKICCYEPRTFAPDNSKFAGFINSHFFLWQELYM